MSSKNIYLSILTTGNFNIKIFISSNWKNGKKKKRPSGVVESHCWQSPNNNPGGRVKKKKDLISTFSWKIRYHVKHHSFITQELGKFKPWLPSLVALIPVIFSNSYLYAPIWKTGEIWLVWGHWGELVAWKKENLWKRELKEKRSLGNEVSQRDLGVDSDWVTEQMSYLCEVQGLVPCTTLNRKTRPGQPWVNRTDLFQRLQDRTNQIKVCDL